MSTSNEELTSAVARLASTVAAMAELQATIAKIVLPLSNHLDECQKRHALTEIKNMTTVVRELQLSINQLASNTSEADKPSVAPLSTEAVAQIRKQINAVETAHSGMVQHAQSGDPKAQFALGKLFEEQTEDPPGEGSWFDLSSPWYEKATEWYHRAAEQGFAPAQYALAVAYRDGSGVTEDREKAISWCRKAKAGGFEPAYLELASLLEETDAEESLALYEASAGQGNVEAMMKLVEIYDDEDGLYLDKNKAFQWVLQAAEAGSADACEKVGSMYLEGDGTPRDFNTAVQWLLKIADPHVASTMSLNWISASPIRLAQFALVRAYADPAFDGRDLAEAYKWFDLAMMFGTLGAEFDEHLEAQRRALTDAMTSEQILEGKRRSAALRAPLNNFVKEICGNPLN
jgi:TPR repeat protein